LGSWNPTEICFFDTIPSILHGLLVDAGSCDFVKCTAKQKVLPSTQDVKREVLTRVGRFMNFKRFRFFRHINIILLKNYKLALHLK